MSSSGWLFYPEALITILLYNYIKFEKSKEMEREGKKEKKKKRDKEWDATTNKVKF